MELRRYLHRIPFLRATQNTLFRVQIQVLAPKKPTHNFGPTTKRRLRERKKHIETPKYKE
jgi:hypothetical protein